MSIAPLELSGSACRVGAGTRREGREVGFGGIARRIERHYRRYRQRGEASSGMEAWLDKVMVEHTCPDCHGARVRATRLLFKVAGKSLHEVGQLHFDELTAFLGGVKPAGRGADAGQQVLKEIRGRLELLASACPLDLHPRAWGDGRCAQTLFGAAPVLLQERSGATRIFVRPSFVDYVVDLLLAAAV